MYHCLKKTWVDSELKALLENGHMCKKRKIEKFREQGTFSGQILSICTDFLL
jgi:hypothetical protein